MLLRKSLLEADLLHFQHRYDKVFMASQVVSDTERKAMKCILDGLLFEIHDIRKELDLVKANEHNYP